MIVRRLQVEEGFLDGLDVEFVPGLNVVIGSRGVGKTSLIELLRFGFGVAGYTDSSQRVAEAHALSVLDSGRVTITVQDQGETLKLVRSASEDRPRVVGSRQIGKPIVLSQNEVEQIGLAADSRMRLLDGFRHGASRVNSAEDAALGMVASLSAEIYSVVRAMLGTRERLAAMQELEPALEAARSEENALTESVKASEPQRERLDALSKLAGTTEVRRDAFETARGRLEQWVDRLRTARRAVPTLTMPTAAGDPGAMNQVAEATAAATTGLDEILAELVGALGALTTEAQDAQSSLVEMQDEARELRRSVDQLAEGAGKAAQKVAAIQSQLAHRAALKEEVAQERSQIAELQKRRSDELERLEAARAQRSQERTAVAARINNVLGPVVHVRLDHDAGVESYAAAIAELLQGSGLHYNNLAPQLAERMSPREFVELVESGDVESLSSLAGISQDRASRVVASADKPSLGQVLTAPIDDHVEITLLDESVPKPTQTLSTGQRCTAVLPILLLHDERVLILDQPEDHLDNAYVVATLVRSLRKRTSASQTIVATHNANIPVLADAQRVLVMGSDGRRGFVRLAAPLADSAVVTAISQVMEGGAEAFRLRAEFYAEHLVDDS